ncbi:mitochondrial carrier [Peniophora sp. CONT]|nr:mitochondrial carrier [Peniophora sp. CONT]
MSSSSLTSAVSNAPRKQRPSFFPSHALDHAAAGLGAGVVAVLCMHPLDLLKVKFQVATTAPTSGIGRQIWTSLRDIYGQGGRRALYRGIGPNIAGNASSWGLYFLFYNQLKRRASEGDLDRALSAGQYLLCSAQASAVTAVMTNPLWVVKVRMFTAPPGSPAAYSGLFHGLRDVYTHEGVRGLWRGTLLALVGVSNGALQFMAYEELKRLGFARKRKAFERVGREWKPGDERLSNTAYTVMSGASKIFALVATYPYQVVRSRMQALPISSSGTPLATTTTPPPSPPHIPTSPTSALASSTHLATSSSTSPSTIAAESSRIAQEAPNAARGSSSSGAGQVWSRASVMSTIRYTYVGEGVRGFYRGLGTNLVRVLPGTCVTFVVYENLAWLLRTAAQRRADREEL